VPLGDGGDGHFLDHGDEPVDLDDLVDLDGGAPGRGPAGNTWHSPFRTLDRSSTRPAHEMRTCGAQYRGPQGRHGALGEWFCAAAWRW